MYLSHKKKVLLSAAVLFALASGEAFASSYHGGTSDVTSSNETLDELYATNKVLCQMLGCPTTKSPFRNSARHLPSSFFANSHRESGS